VKDKEAAKNKLQEANIDGAVSFPAALSAA